MITFCVILFSDFHAFPNATYCRHHPGQITVSDILTLCDV